MNVFLQRVNLKSLTFLTLWHKIDFKVRKMLQNNQFSNFHLILLRCISSGYKDEKQIGQTLNTDKEIVKRKIEELVKRGLIKRHGLISKKLRLTDTGVNLMSYYGHMPQVQLTKPQSEVQKQEIKQMHTTTFGTRFKLVFGTIMGIFFSWLIIGMIASLIYWTGYYFIIRKYVPPAILTYIPLENPLVFIFLGLNTSAAIFLPIKRQVPLINANEGIAVNT
jgi:predicted transcriptional regulator